MALAAFGIVWESTLQELVPGEAPGRVASIEMIGSFALLPVGFLLIGALVAAAGPAAALALAGGASAIQELR